MPFSIVRNDITKMNTDAIVNTANPEVKVGPGCDTAVYQAAGFDELLAYRKEKIGPVKEGEVFLTPGFGLPAKYIIHAVSPLFVDGESGEEEKLRSCYRRSLVIAAGCGFRTVAFPLISTGSYGYPKEEGLRIAVEEIGSFLETSSMIVYIVVFDRESVAHGKKIDPDLRAYITQRYAEDAGKREYERADGMLFDAPMAVASFAMPDAAPSYDEASAEDYEAEANRAEAEDGRALQRRTLRDRLLGRRGQEKDRPYGMGRPSAPLPGQMQKPSAPLSQEAKKPAAPLPTKEAEAEAALFSKEEFDIERLERELEKRTAHLQDSFSDYLLFLIESKGMTNSDVWHRALIGKKVFSKIKNDKHYQPSKLTALCLCVGAKLSLDETKDLLGRAGYALSPADLRDVIFSFYIEHGIYDMVDIDIKVEEYGLPCMIE